MIDLVRAPLIGELPARLSWLVVLGLNVVNMLVAMALLRRASKRLVYWL
jgi:ABC-type polysaccharide/polyol phosphate export permease